MSKISTGLAKQLIYNFRVNQATRLDQDETKAVWFSRDEIMEILDTLVKGKLPSGIRFYFAAYEGYDETGQREIPAYVEEGDKMTLVMIPTTEYNNAGNSRRHNYRLDSNLHFDLLENPGEPMGYDKSFMTEGNDGQICPPPSDAELLP